MTTQTLGILMLDTQFPRPIGDIGNPGTFSYPTRFKCIPNASPVRVIHEQAAGLLDAFCDGARELERDGCAAIVTSCGFLALHQQRIADSVCIPVATSSLLLIPLLTKLFSAGGKIGVLTASANSLSSEHLIAVGASPDTPVMGVEEGGEFARVIIGDQPEGRFDLIRDEVVEAARRLMATHATIRALLLECTNMRPYAADIRRQCGVPVFDLVDLADFWMCRENLGTAASLKAPPLSGNRRL